MTKKISLLKPMTEKTILLEGIDPVAIFGVNHTNFEKICNLFPKLRLIARGDELKVMGEPEDIDLFEKKIENIIDWVRKYSSLTETDLNRIVEHDQDTPLESESPEEDVIVYGNNGKSVRARTFNQKKLVEDALHNDLLLAIGPAGTGKTYTAIALAVKAFKNKSVKKIILTRPAVEAGEHLGFLPGDMRDKLDPYLQPLYDALHDMVPAKKLESLIEDGTVQIAPLAYMRGRTLDNAFVILDEAQNATYKQLKMFLTRMGKNAKFIVTGDITQIDLPDPSKSGLICAMQILKDIHGISIVHFDERDIIRHRLVKRIIEAYNKVEATQQTKA
jgi:phosphate starvation-inducible PhoH-like protein